MKNLDYDHALLLSGAATDGPATASSYPYFGFRNYDSLAYRFRPTAHSVTGLAGETRWPNVNGKQRPVGADQ
ncbi:MAG: hypothetical protein ACJ74Z_01530 [Bryobacteraceae bacterium]